MSIFSKKEKEKVLDNYSVNSYISGVNLREKEMKTTTTIINTPLVLTERDAVKLKLVSTLNSFILGGIFFGTPYDLVNMLQRIYNLFF